MTASSFCSIAWNEMLWSAWMPPIMRPVSCCGKKPFGMIMNSQTFSTIVAKQKQHDEPLWRSAHASVRL